MPSTLKDLPNPPEDIVAPEDIAMPDTTQVELTAPEQSPELNPEEKEAYSKMSQPTDDPMIKAIQEQIGQDLNPASATVSTTTEEDNILGPYEEGEIFRAVGLTKAYGSGVAYTEVIKGVSFKVMDGDYLVIFGPSGSGKSTLLHLLAGLEKPTRGEIRVRDRSLDALSDEEMAYYHREEIGMVFQNFNLLETLTVWENVAFPLMLAGAPMEWRHHEALKVLDRFELTDFANYLPNQLSGGQQQRVSLARALIHDPDLLLIDEPTGNLDSASANLVLDEIDRLHKQEERTIILVTHNQVFLTFATRVFYIKDGNLLTTHEYGILNPPE